MKERFWLFAFFLSIFPRQIKTEAQAQAQQQNHSTPLTEASGEILNNTGNLELQQATRHLTCNLRNMQLKKIKRAEKKGTESVMDEKFALLFQSKFQTGDMQLNVRTSFGSFVFRLIISSSSSTITNAT